MKSIKFTDDELEFLREQQQAELEQTEKYLDELKKIVEKLGLPKVFDPDEILETNSGIKKRKPRSDKGVKRGKSKKVKIEIIPKEKPVQPADSSKPAVKPSKAAKPSNRKKKSWNSSKRTRGVFLAPLRKPLVLKEPVEPEPGEEASEKKE